MWNESYPPAVPAENRAACDGLRIRQEASGRRGSEAEGRDSTQHLDWADAQRVVLPKLKPSTKTNSVRLPQHLLDAIKAAANARDVPYQSLIKVWLQEKVGQ